MKIKLLGYYNYTVVLTYIGVLFGILGIMSALNNNIKLSMICLMLCGLCDMFDGAIASTMDRTDDEKNFGIQIDSLSDLICFCILPSSILLAVSGNMYSIVAAYTLCGLIRLAFFNVDEQNRQKNTSESREIYFGLPVTSVAITYPLAYIICNTLHLNISMILSITLLVSAFLFLVPFKIRKPHTAGKIILALCGLAIFILLFALTGEI